MPVAPYVTVVGPGEKLVPEIVTVALVFAGTVPAAKPAGDPRVSIDTGI